MQVHVILRLSPQFKYQIQVKFIYCTRLPCFMLQKSSTSKISQFRAPALQMNVKLLRQLLSFFPQEKILTINNDRNTKFIAENLFAVCGIGNFVAANVPLLAVNSIHKKSLNTPIHGKIQRKTEANLNFLGFFFFFAISAGFSSFLLTSMSLYQDSM